MNDTITLPRSVLEKALKLWDAQSIDENYDYGGAFLRWNEHARPEELASQFRAALEQPQVEQEPVAWRLFDGDPFPGTATRYVYYDKDDFKEGVNPTEHFQLEPLYTHPQNLRCKSNQARLATLWGYEKPQPPRQPLTDEEIDGLLENVIGSLPVARNLIRAIERAHGIGGNE